MEKGDERRRHRPIKPMKDKFAKKNKKKLEKPKVRKVDLRKEKINSLTSTYETIDVKELKLFSDFPLSDGLKRGLKEAGYDKPTEIQRESIGLALRGLDILGAAKTGSGKTLAFIIPILEKLYTSQWSRNDGVGALIITPTRELAYQIFESFRKVGKFHEFSAGLVIGGKDLKFEWNRLQSCNIVVCTPGRLLQHLDENPAFNMDNLQMLVLDEADRCLDLGFQQAMNSIVEALPKERQTLLFSATQTRSVTDLARLSLEKPVYVSVHEHSSNSTPDNLTQSYVVTDLHNKVNILWSFLKSHKRKKTLVFLQSCKQVKYIYEVFCRLRPGLSVMALYGSLHQLKRMAIYDQFCDKQAAVLLATDIAARGLDFPAVDWVIQLDCPEDGTTYVHRAGRTARYNTAGESLLVLLPQEEQGMLKQLSAHKIPISKIEINPNKQQTIEKTLAAQLASDTNLKESAQRAFTTYLKSVYLMKNKSIFDVFSLDTAKFATSLGLALPPRLRFLDKQKKLKAEQQQKKKAKTVNCDDSNDADIMEAKLEDSDGLKLGESSDDESDEEVFTVKRKNVQIEIDDNEAENDNAQQSKKADIVLNKVQAAKRVLKKNIIANSRLTFDEDGDTLTDTSRTKVSVEGREYEEEDLATDAAAAAAASGKAGIDIERVKAVMRAEDKFDRQRQRQRQKEERKKKKEKEAEQRKRKRAPDDEDEDSESDESVDLSWLPDPDKVYKDEADRDSNSSSVHSDSEQEVTEIKDNLSKVTVIKKRIPKRQKSDPMVNEEANLPRDTGLSLEDDEDLALQLLAQ